MKSESQSSYAASCSSCDSLELCKHTFKGNLYAAKSHGGTGCNHPITVTPDHIRGMIIANEKADEKADCTSHKSKTTLQQKQSVLWHKYIVTHRLKEYPTTAHSPEQAVNFVRFKLYGTRPADTLPPFSVRDADGETTRTDRRTATNGRLSFDAMRKRLGRMVS